MKAQIITMALLSISLFAGAQSVKQRNVPDVVVSSIQTRYPSAENISWTSKGIDYTADFKTEKLSHKVYIAPEGTILRTEDEIKKESLPLAVQERIETDFHGMTIDTTERLQIHNQVYYIVNLSGAPGADRKITFCPNGQIEVNKLD